MFSFIIVGIGHFGIVGCKFQNNAFPSIVSILVYEIFRYLHKLLQMPKS